MPLLSGVAALLLFWRLARRMLEPRAAVFVAGGISLGLAWAVFRSRSRRAWVLWLVYNVVISASFVAFYVLFTAPHSGRAADSWLEDYWRDSFLPTKGFLPAFWWMLKIHAGRMLAYPTGGANFGSSFTTIACLIGAVSLLVRRRGNILLLLVAPALPGLIAAVLHRYPYGGSVRVSIYLGPIICLLAVGRDSRGARLSATDQVPRSCSRCIWGVYGQLHCFWSGACDVIRPYKTPLDQGIRRAMRVVIDQVVPGEAVAIINPPYRTYGPPDGPKIPSITALLLGVIHGHRTAVVLL